MQRRRNILAALTTGSVLCAFVPACQLVLASDDNAQGNDDSDSDDDDNDDDDGTSVCTEPTEVPCRDQSFVALNMNLTEAAEGEITSEDDGAGGFGVTIDSTAGAPPGAIDAPGGFVYAKFTDTGLEKVDLLDDESFDSMDWDIAFRRFVIRLNSGTSGPSCVAAARTPTATDYATLNEVPEGLTFRAENFMSDPESCELVPDGSGLETAGVVLQNWWRYPGCVATTGNVYVLSLADGRHVKLVVDAYYASGQEDCNDRGTPGRGSANLQLRYAFVPYAFVPSIQ
jgi:hypothetical protein